MYAVLMTGGKQYRVEAGSTLVVEKVGGEPGSSITFDRILLVGDGEDVMIGSPTVPGASVSATVLGEALGPKIVVFKFKQKVKYRRRTGHRQHLTRLRIDSISADGKTVKAEPPEPAAKRKAARTKTAVAAAAEEKPGRRRAKAESSATAEAKVEATPAPRRSRERAAPKTKATEAPEKAPSPARPRRTKASGEASMAKADEKASSAAETKPRARRTNKPKTESAKEE
jgi:large subunit ribosomal protein L21